MTGGTQSVFSFGEFGLNVRDRRLVRAGVEIAMTPKTFDTLRYLVENRGRVVTKEELRGHLWPDVTVDPNALLQCISRVRKALGGLPYLETVSGIGYRFAAPVIETPIQANAAPVSPRPARHLWIPVAAAIVILAVATPVARFALISGPRRDPRSVDDAAWKSYVRGRGIWTRRELAPHPEAAAYLMEAVRRDPNFALGWVGLADFYLMQAPPQPEAWNAISRALAIDPGLGEAWSSAGFYKMTHQWDWQEAGRDLRKGVRLAPSYEYGHKWLGEYLAITGHMNQAIAELEVAVRQHPESAAAQAGLCRILYFSGRVREAEDHCQIAVDTAPDFRMAHRTLYAISADLGKDEGTVDHWLQAGAMSLRDAGNPYVLAYRREGIRAMWQKALADSPDWANVSKAEYSLRAGDQESALGYLERARDRHEFLLSWAGVEPAFISLRGQPRFQKVLQSMGL